VYNPVRLPWHGYGLPTRPLRQDLLVHQFNSSATAGVPGGGPVVVLLNPAGHVFGDAGVKRAVGAPQHVDEPDFNGPLCRVVSPPVRCVGHNRPDGRSRARSTGNRSLATGFPDATASSPRFPYGWRLLLALSLGILTGYGRTEGRPCAEVASSRSGPARLCAFGFVRSTLVSL
jgi:hypothetical protein